MPPASTDATGITNDSTPHAVLGSDLTSRLDAMCFLPLHVSRNIFYPLSNQNRENITSSDNWQESLYWLYEFICKGVDVYIAKLARYYGK
jgi:hypothetical protein